MPSSLSRLVEASANVLKDFQGGVSTSADNVGKMLRAAITAFSGLLIAEMLCVADKKKGIGQFV